VLAEARGAEGEVEALARPCAGGQRHRRGRCRGGGDVGAEERWWPRSRMEKGDGELGYIGGLPLVLGGATTRALVPGGGSTQD
jgi:hypothetical protein